MKTTGHNLDEQLQDIIRITENGFRDNRVPFFINSVSGLDTNDGKSKETPFKTFRPVEEIINFAPSFAAQTTIVNVAAGEYDYVNFVDAHTSKISIICEDGAVFTGNSQGSVIFRINVSGRVLVYNAHIKPTHTTTAFIEVISSRLFVEKCTFDGTNLISDGKSYLYGINANDSTVYTIEGKMINLKYAVRAVYNSNVYLNTSVDERSAYTLIESGSSFGYNAPVTTRKLIDHAFPGTLGVSATQKNLINDGIVVEEGRNANGTYIKYANGIIIMNYIKNTAVSDLRDAESGSIVNGQNRFTLTYPHTVVEVLSSEMSGFITNSVTGLLPKVRIQKGVTTGNMIYGFIMDDTAAVANQFRSDITQILNLSFTITGRWK